MLLAKVSEQEAQALQESGVPDVLINALIDIFEVLNTTEARDRHWSTAMVGYLLNTTARALLTAEAAVHRRLSTINRVPPSDVRRDRLEVLMGLGRAIPVAARNVVLDRLETAWLTPDAPTVVPASSVERTERMQQTEVEDAKRTLDGERWHLPCRHVWA